MHYLALGEVLELHHRILHQTGGAEGVRDLAGIESALTQPQMIFAGQELYPTIGSKAASLCFSLVTNHPFIDGNKRTGHAAMEVFLILNGFELAADIDDTEQTILRLAEGRLARDMLVDWVTRHVQPVS